MINVTGKIDFQPVFNAHAPVYLPGNMLSHPLLLMSLLAALANADCPAVASGGRLILLPRPIPVLVLPATE